MTFWKLWLRGWRCLWLTSGRHDWKKARRTTEIFGYKACRYCDARQWVVLRKRAPTSSATPRTHQPPAQPLAHPPATSAVER